MLRRSGRLVSRGLGGWQTPRVCPDSMNQKLTSLSHRYAVALSKHLRQDSSETLLSALGFAREAAGLELEPKVFTRIHDRALAALETAPGQTELKKRAQAFLAAVLSRRPRIRPGARQGKTELSRLNQMLDRRTLKLAATNRRLRRDLLRRKSEEAALRGTGEHYARLLRQSLRLQEQLRLSTHRLLASREEDRKKLSVELRDEVAQTLLGVNVRLLSLKEGARKNKKGLKEEIASARRLVVESARSVRRVARKFGKA